MESIAAEWKAAGKRGRSLVGKSARQSEDVMRIEIKVEKLAGWPSRKAAIVYAVPVP